MVLREAVTNVIRHAHAQQCEIDFQADDNFLQLRISDDGRGGRITLGNGLGGMRERVEQLNGRLRIDSGNGTRISIQLPRQHTVTPLHPWQPDPWNNAA